MTTYFSRRQRRVVHSLIFVARKFSHRSNTSILCWYQCHNIDFNDTDCRINFGKYAHHCCNPRKKKCLINQTTRFSNNSASSSLFPPDAFWFIYLFCPLMWYLVPRSRLVYIYTLLRRCTCCEFSDGVHYWSWPVVVYVTERPEWMRVASG